jgi:hypothetical protein
MNKELKNRLETIFSNKANWNKHIDVDGNRYIYISAKNELRKEVTNGAILVGFFIDSLTFANGVMTGTSKKLMIAK